MANLAGDSVALLFLHLSQLTLALLLLCPKQLRLFSNIWKRNSRNWKKFPLELGTKRREKGMSLSLIRSCEIISWEMYLSFSICSVFFTCVNYTFFLLKFFDHPPKVDTEQRVDQEKRRKNTRWGPCSPENHSPSSASTPITNFEYINNEWNQSDRGEKKKISFHGRLNEIN